jgi:hypothetical protein
MTLQDFFQICAENPAIILFYYLALPLTALLAGIFGKGEGHISPWKYLYSALVYLAAVPGVFSIMLSLYLFLFERRPILETDIYYQILPVISMVVTLWLINRNVELEKVPGFGKIGGLFIMIVLLLSILWILDKTHIIAITFIRFEWIILLLIAMLVVMRLAWKKVFE